MDPRPDDVVGQSELVKTRCLTSAETIRLIRDGEKGGDVEEEGAVTEGYHMPIATLSPRVSRFGLAVRR